MQETVDDGTMAEGDTFVNAAIGAVVGVVLSGFVPFSPVLGGAVSGYLQGGDREGGVRIGALAGAIMLVPMLILFVVVVGPIFLAVLGMSGMGMGNMGLAGAIGGAFFLFALLLGLVYTVGFAALGGWLGNYVRYETDIEL